MDLRASRILSVCTGTGMLDVGVRVAIPTARVVCCVEHEAFAAHILASRMEEEALDPAPIWTDLHTFHGEEWAGFVDGIVGGYPCQPFSHAGKRLGAEDPRHLWPEVLRLIREVSPEWCFFENVRGHLGNGFDVVYRELREVGFCVEAGLFSAEEVGASHQRERLFILAYRPDSVDPRGHGERAAQGGGSESGLERHGQELADSEYGTGGASARVESEVQPPLTRRRGNPMADAQDHHGRRGERRTEAAARAGDIGRRRPPGGGGEMAHTESEGLQGVRSEDSAWGSFLTPLRGDGGEGPLPVFAPGPGDLRIWGRVVSDGSLNGLAPSTQPGVRMLADGVALVVDESRRDQLRAIGNGVVPLQAAYALSVLARRAGLILE